MILSIVIILMSASVLECRGSGIDSPVRAELSTSGPGAR